MTITSLAFNPEILNNWEKLNHFFDSKSEVGKINSDQTPVSSLLPLQSMSNWQIIVWDIQSTAQGLYGLFLQAVSLALDFVGATNLSKQCTVISKHQMNAFRIAAIYLKFQENLLMPSTNAHAIDSSELFLMPDQSISFPQIGLNKKMNFFHPNGVCRGMSDWFLHLYFQTKPHFQNAENHIKTVGKIFEKGAPTQASLLQSFALPATEILLKFNTENLVEDHDIDSSDAAQKINALEAGTYAIYTPYHRINYIKEADGQAFIYDPNHGCIRIDNLVQLDWMMQKTNKDNASISTFLIDRVDPS